MFSEFSVCESLPHVRPQHQHQGRAIIVVSCLFCVDPYTSLYLIHKMAPHMTPKEQGMAIAAAGQARSTNQIFDVIRKKREKDNSEMVDITNVRRFLRGATHKCGAKETRGRKRIYSRRNVLSMNAARRKFIKKSTNIALGSLIVIRLIHCSPLP